MNWSSAREKLLKLAMGRRPPASLDPRSRDGPRVGRRLRFDRPARSASPSLRVVGQGVALLSVPVPAGRRLAAPALTVRSAAARSAGARLGPLPAASLCIASGKGGTGKSVVSACLAKLFSASGRTLLVDADLGVGNAHILQDVAPPKSCVDVVEGDSTVREVLVRCSERVDLLPAGSGVPRMAGLSQYELHLIATGLEELELEYRFLLFDSAAGLSRQTVSFAASSDVVLIVTTPDLTAMTDAYAFLKVLTVRDRDLRPLLLVNRAPDEASAREVAERIERVSRRFLDCGTTCIGWLPEDPAVSRCVNQRGPVVALEPETPFSVAVRAVSVRLLETLAARPPRGAGAALRSVAGYPPRLC